MKCFAFLLAGSLGLVGQAGFAQAGGYGCRGECYHEAILPPVYGTVSERVLLSPPRTYDVVTPATYRTETETVEIAPARREWQVTRDAWGRRVGCWVDLPARYGVRQRTVMVSAASSVPVTQLPVYGSRERTVLVEPARRAWVPAPHGAPFYGQPDGYSDAPIRAAY